MQTKPIDQKAAKGMGEHLAGTGEEWPPSAASRALFVCLCLSLMLSRMLSCSFCHHHHHLNHQSHHHYYQLFRIDTKT